MRVLEGFGLYIRAFFRFCILYGLNMLSFVRWGYIMLICEIHQRQPGSKLMRKENERG